MRNLLDPKGLEGLSVGTMLLALTGNALMVPRALLTRDLVWLAGTSWCACEHCVQAEVCSSMARCVFVCTSVFIVRV